MSTPPDPPTLSGLSISIPPSAPPPSSPNVPFSPSKSVGWGLPPPIELESRPQSLGGKQRLDPGYVRRRATSIVDDCSPGNPVVVWESLMKKKRRVLGGFVNVIVSFVLYCECDEKGQFYYVPGLVYRSHSSIELPYKMRIIIDRVEEWEPPTGVIPNSDGGVKVYGRTLHGKGKDKVYELCLIDEVRRNEMIRQFKGLKRKLIALGDVANVKKVDHIIADNAANGSREIQLVLLNRAVGQLMTMSQLYNMDIMKDENTDDHIERDLMLIKGFTELLTRCKTHMNEGNKDGGSLQYKRLEQFVEQMEIIVKEESALKSKPEKLRAYITSPVHRGAIENSFALVCVVVEDLQFGMSDIEQFREDRALVKSLSEELHSSAGSTLTEPMKKLMSPRHGEHKPAIRSRANSRYGSIDEGYDGDYGAYGFGKNETASNRDSVVKLANERVIRKVGMSSDARLEFDTDSSDDEELGLDEMV